jgi:formate dehydrogenase subunit gamma
MSRLPARLGGLALAGLLALPMAWAQAPAAAVAAPAVAASPAATPAAPAAASAGGIQSQNIFDVKPDASADPNYAKQSNAERSKVQPGNNAPMWRSVGQGSTGHSSLPQREAPEAGNLVQPFVQYPGSKFTTAGEAWRQVRNQWIIPYGGALILIALVALGLFYWGRGTMELHGAETGRKIERFTPFERAAHWTNAIAFTLLAISGLVMAFGKNIIQPIIGSSLFGWLTYALKNIHNFAGPVFAVSLVVVILTFVKDNFPRAGDLGWLLKGGGMLSKGASHVPSHRFNAGEKVLFWIGVFAFGLLVVASGLVLNKLVPGFGDTRSDMQMAHMVHAAAAMCMMALFLGHIYMGTLGVRGAYQAMRTGYVDETWAKEHHEHWHDDVKSGKIPAQRSASGVVQGAVPLPGGAAQA